MSDTDNGRHLHALDERLEQMAKDMAKRLDRIERRLGLVEPPPWPGQE